MSVVTFTGGPVTHRYFMKKTKSWLAYEIVDCWRILSKLVSIELAGPEPERWTLLVLSKHELARSALRLHGEIVSARVDQAALHATAGTEPF